MKYGPKQNLTKLDIEKVLSLLNEREIFILCLRNFSSLAYIGKRIGVCTQRVRQIEQLSIRKLERELKEIK